MFVCLCLSAFVCLSLSFSLSVCVCLCICIFCLCFDQCICVCLCLLCVCVSVSLSVYVCVSIRMNVLKFFHVQRRFILTGNFLVSWFWDFPVEAKLWLLTVISQVNSKFNWRITFVDFPSVIDLFISLYYYITWHALEVLSVPPFGWHHVFKYLSEIYAFKLIDQTIIYVGYNS